MKILEVPDSPHVYLRRLRQGLSERGHVVDEAPFPYLRWPGNTVKFMRQFLRQHDLIHLHWSIFDSLTAARLFFSTKTPKIWTVHNIVPHVPLLRDDLLASHAYLDGVDIAVWHSARSIDEARRRFGARGLPETWNAKNRVIPLMSFNGIWPDTVSDDEARRRIGVDGDAPVVGHFAPTQPYKGTRRFVDLMTRIGRPDVVYCIFGACHDSSLEQEIRAAAAASPNLRIHLVRLPDDELQYWFKACNVVVQPYTEVTTSGSIFFPIAFKIPVIASPLGNIPDVIQHRVTGWLADDADSLAGCIEEALGDPKATRAMGERAHQFVDETANIDIVTEAHIRAYEAALER